MTKYAILIVLITLVSASALTAEEESVLVQRRSKTKAAAYSLVTTLVPEGISILFLASGRHTKVTNRAWFAFGLSGPVFGPGAGHLYAGNTRKFNNATLLRGCLSIVGVAALFSSESDAAGVVALSSGAIVAFSMIYDIATVGKSVDKYNHSHGFASLRARPHYFAASKAVGLNVSMSL